MFLGTFGLLANLVQTGRHPRTHPPTRAPPTRAPPTHPPSHAPGRHECFWARSGFSPIWSKQPECQKRIFLGTFRLRPNLVRTAGRPKTIVFGHTRASAQFGPNSRDAKNESFWAHSGFGPIWSEGAGMPKTNVFGHIRASAQFGPNSRNAKNESFWAHSGFSPIWSEQPEGRKGMFLNTFGLQANLVRTGRHPPTHPGATHPPTHPPGRHPPGRHPATHPPNRAPGMFLGNLVRTAGMPKTNVFGHIRASGQFGPNREQRTHPPTHPPRRHLPGRHPPTHPPTWAPRMFLGTFQLQANLVQTGRHAPTHPPIRAPPTRAPPTHPPTHPPRRHECFWAPSGFSPIWSEQPECRKRMFLGTFGLQPNLVRIAGTPKTNLFGHIRASAQFGPNSRNAENKSFWAHSGFRPIWSEPGATHPPNHPPARHPPTHPPTRAPGMFLGNLVRTAGMPKTNLFGHIRASAQFAPNSRNAENECFWAHSGFRPIWSKPGATHPPTHPPTRAPPTRAPPTHPPTHLGATNVFEHIPPSGQFGPNRAPRTHPPTHPPGRHPPGRHPPTHPPTHPGATDVFVHLPASAQFGPNSRNAKTESFWAHSGFSPIWSEQPECQKRIFWGTFGLQPNLVRTAGMPKRNVFGHIRASGQFGPNRAPPTHPPTHPGATHPPTHPPGRHPPTHQPTRAPRMFLGTFRLQPNLVRTARMPKTNLFGHIQASAQFGPESRNAENECFWAHSGFSPIWSAQPECQKRIFWGTFGLQPNLVRTAGMPKRNVFGHIRASGQFGPNRAPPTHPPTHPRATHPPTHPPGRHPPGHPATGEPRMFLGTFGLQPNLVPTAGMPKTNLFGHIRASAQFGPNSQNAEKEFFWAHSGFRPIWSEPGATHPPTHPPGRHPPTHPPTPGATHPGATHPPTQPTGRHECFWAHSGFSPIWSQQPECQKRIFLGTFGLQPNLVRTAGMPKRNVFGHIRASGQFGPNRAPPTHPPTHPRATHPPTHPPGRHPPGHPATREPRMFLGTFGLQPKHSFFGPNSRNAKNECFWAHSGFSPIWSEQPECRKRMFLGTFGLQANFVQTGSNPPTHPPTHPSATYPGATHPPSHPRGRHECFGGHIPASGQFGPNRAPRNHPPTRPGATHPGATHPPTHPGATNVFGHIPASAQFGPNSRNAKNESFWAHSGFSPIWSEQPECQKRIFWGTFGLQPNLVRTAGMPKRNVFGHIRASGQFGPNRAPPTHPPTHPGATHPPTHPPGRHPPTHQPTWAPRMFLGTFRLQPNLVRTAGMPKTNLFGHIQASAQFGPDSRNAENECFWAHSGFRPTWSETAGTPKRNVFGHIRASGQFGPNRAPPTHPPTHPGATHPPAHPPGRHPPTHPPSRAPRMCLGRFGLQPNLVRTARMPKRNFFGHIRASGQFGPNRAPPTHPPTQPGATHPPTHPPGRHECFWAHSGFSPIWSEQPECQKRIFLGTFRLRPNLVPTAGMPKTNVFGHTQASAQFGPHSRNAENESFWARSGFSPIWSEQPECRKGMFLGTFGLQANLVRTGRHPPTQPPTRAPPTHPPTRPGAKNVFGQFGPNSRNA